MFWQANATDARGQALGETLGNGLVTARNFDAVTGRVRSIQSGLGGGSAVQNLAYLWDMAGNLLLAPFLQGVRQPTFAESMASMEGDAAKIIEGAARTNAAVNAAGATGVALGAVGGGIKAKCGRGK